MVPLSTRLLISLQGTKFELHRLKKYNRTMLCLSSYYITLVAYDPATRSFVNFQAGFGQLDSGILSVRCFVARLQGKVTEINVSSLIYIFIMRSHFADL